MGTLNLLHRYFTDVRRNPRVLELCGIDGPDVPYPDQRDDDLTAIVTGYGRPEYLPLVWEGLQYQTRRPRETWIVQNGSRGRYQAPREFFDRARAFRTPIIDSDLNHGCWFRVLLAALYCRTRYVAIFDDDTLPGRLAMETALAEMERQPGVYGCWGATFLEDPAGPRYWHREVAGWQAARDDRVEVDFVGQMWLLETDWLKAVFHHLPERLFSTPEPGRECGEEMLISFVAQRMGRPTFIYGLGREYNARWASIQGIEMGPHPGSMTMTGGLAHADHYLRTFRAQGWRLLRYDRRVV